MVYVGLIVFFCYFYTAIMINPADVAENIKRSGAYIPGIRPGKKTAEHIDRILSRITLIGALYISAVCVLPTLLAARMGVPFYFGGTALLIVVGVGLDTIAQIEAHLVSRQYEGFAQGTRIRGRLAAMSARRLLLLGPPGRRQGHAGRSAWSRARRPADLDRRRCCAPRSPRRPRSASRRRR